VTLLRTLWRTNRWALVGFAFAAALTLFFAGRTLVFALYWADPAHQNEPVAAWMTLGYVEKSWDLPPRSLAGPLRMGPPDKSRGPKSIAEYARERGVTAEQFVAEVQAAVKTVLESEAAQAGGE
jgi:hypothetical protein